MHGDDGERGLDAGGYIRREGSLDRVAPAFDAVVTSLGGCLAARFGSRLHSGYLYGSIPRGTAVPGRSDLDAVVLLRESPTGPDLEAVAGLAYELDQRHAVIDGAGLLLWPVSRILDPAERYDLGFFLACLCTPLLGEDVGCMLPRYRPTRRLACDTNGDITAFLARARERLEGTGGADVGRLCRQVARKLVRTGFTLVMPRWGGWAGSLDVMAAVFGRYYPAQAGAMAGAARLAVDPSSDPVVVAGLITGVGGWLAGEYGRVIGVKRAPS